jgi:hypothetical protein
MFSMMWPAIIWRQPVRGSHPDHMAKARALASPVDIGGAESNHYARARGHVRTIRLATYTRVLENGHNGPPRVS